MHCTAFQLFCQGVGLQQENELCRIGDIYPSPLKSRTPYLIQTPTPWGHRRQYCPLLLVSYFAVTSLRLHGVLIFAPLSVETIVLAQST